ncbi:RsmD family RNA methyltransferase [Galbitalea sp. SE-J8]|uniref:RsmD family RNA methyltransferase n=1 Tax=Galbitalea sp. SE-J8 TaxID=3054952 RepID=UPI00259D286D|nr:RsmD family RNA methyltransferase [Galbitalea sp. SE-J8]MDM4762974.1 RsmD family RNA methyltransferase [Galbitalea sp. SE-J8]
MTRIIAGFAGSLALRVPSSGTRPTSDRVREALFSALEARDVLRGARVVDLYAGSGALGLEAASRGAASVVLVERASAAAADCRRNAAAVLRNAPRDAPPRVEVAAQAVGAYLATAAATWDLALVDPPYDLGAAELTAALGLLAPRLADDALVVVERRTRDGEPGWPDHLEPERSRAYGDTTLWYATRVAQPARPDQPA